MRSGAVAASEPGGHHDVVRGLHPGRHRHRQAAELGLRRVCVRYGPAGAGGGAERRVSASPALTRRPRPPRCRARPGPALRAASGGQSCGAGPVPSGWGRCAEPSRAEPDCGAGPVRHVCGPASSVPSAAPPPAVTAPPAPCGHLCCVSAGPLRRAVSPGGQRRASPLAWSAALQPLGLRGPFAHSFLFLSGSPCCLSCNRPAVGGS